jgi:hypothetical protein
VKPAGGAMSGTKVESRKMPSAISLILVCMMISTMLKMQGFVGPYHGVGQAPYFKIHLCVIKYEAPVNMDAHICVVKM